ncbi:desulfoferrodoxin family protein [Phosphitispora sp. TUW77]|uniref:desulfoferrodoxin family protein n=1 Tax=Phosphitispora sp. TUW77 TaxID=3152361 RepID=UPI003AB3107A
MNDNVAFYRCDFCGNIVDIINNGGGELACCSNPMTKLEANITDASEEKHVPTASRKDGKIYVEVGSVPHPMTETHYIEWIVLVSGNSIERISLAPVDEPKAVFCDRPDAGVYAFCNLHGLWKTAV